MSFRCWGAAGGRLGGGSAPEQQTGIRERRCSVQVVGRAGHRYARSEEAYTYNFPAAWELLLWKIDHWGIRVLQQWPLAPRELWPTIGRETPCLTAGQAVRVLEAVCFVYTCRRLIDLSLTAGAGGHAGWVPTRCAPAPGVQRGRGGAAPCSNAGDRAARELLHAGAECHH